MQQRTNDEYSLVTAPVLVTGGTGRLGRLVVPRLREAGHHVRVLGRHNHETNDGIEHLAGASNAKGDDQATRNLVRREPACGT